MLITRTSLLSKLTRTKEFPTVTEEQLERWDHGELVQNVFPDLSDDDREFIMTGITPEEWDELFPND
jgi:hypothetical protein